MRHFMTFSVLLSAAVLAGCAPPPTADGPAPRRGGSFAERIAGDLVRADGSVAPADALAEKTVLLYFSAQWCPPCKAFTPVLVQAYEQWRRDNKPVELVFVSFDHSAADMRNYMHADRMPWLAVPFADEARRQSLAEHWRVRGIPALVAVSPDGKTLTKDGVAAIRARQAAALDGWLRP